MNLKKYILEAIDNYPYDLVQTIESLDYALAYEPDNVVAHVIYGRLYSEQFMDYETAIQYFETALSLDVNCLMIYEYYSNTLIKVGNFDKAIKLLEYAKGVIGISMIDVHKTLAEIYEFKNDFKQALENLYIASEKNCSNHCTESIEKNILRIKEKIKKQMPKYGFSSVMII